MRVEAVKTALVPVAAPFMVSATRYPQLIEDAVGYSVANPPYKLLPIAVAAPLMMSATN